MLSGNVSHERHTVKELAEWYGLSLQKVTCRYIFSPEFTSFLLSDTFRNLNIDDPCWDP